MHCAYCLGQLPDGATFCPHCGKAVEAKDPQGYKAEITADSPGTTPKIPHAPPQALWQEVAGDTPRPQAPHQPASAAPKKGGNGGKIAALVAAVALVVLAVFFLWPKGDDGGAVAKGDDTTPSGSATTAPGKDASAPAGTTAAKGDSDAADEAMDILAVYGLSGLKLPEGATIYSNPDYVAAHVPSALHAITVHATTEAIDLYDFTEQVARHAADNGLELYSNDASFSLDGKASKLKDFTFNSTIYGIIYVYEGTQYLLHMTQPNSSPTETTFRRGDIMLAFYLSDDALGGDS